MIEVRGLTKQFGRTLAVNDASFDVSDGAIFCLLGPNGSGKTTTLKMLAGLVRPTVGSIMVNRHPVTGDALEAKREMSYLPQQVAFPESLTAREILHYFARLRGIEDLAVEKALESSGLAGVATRSVGEFSGGMIQRLGLAVITMPNTPILLLDEPTASLDPEGVVQFRNFILDQKQLGKTIIFSTHLLAEAERLADVVAIYLGGRLVTLQTSDQLRSEASAFQTMEDFYLHYVGSEK